MKVKIPTDERWTKHGWSKSWDSSRLRPQTACLVFSVRCSRGKGIGRPVLWSCQCDIKMAVRSAGVRIPQDGFDWRRPEDLSSLPSSAANTPDIGPARMALHSSKTGRTLDSQDVIHLAKTLRALSKTAGFSRSRCAINRSISSGRASMAECGFMGVVCDRKIGLPGFECGTCRRGAPALATIRDWGRKPSLDTPGN